ncbi:MAG: DUF924 family protein [Hyphomicrobiales bacterium]|nr:DUF924 family protein [Alphaproteobacteria bacterium]
MIAAPEDVLAFWREAGPDKWFTKDAAFDDAIRSRFLATYEAAAAGQLAAWEATADGALALTIVLDQFPRNMFRGDARSHAADALALAVADRALARGFDRGMPVSNQQFFYLPFEHSESLRDQERCCALFAATSDADLLKWAHIHADIIRRFGRFPHRNALLGRTTTADEQAFLDAGGFNG